MNTFKKLTLTMLLTSSVLTFGCAQPRDLDSIYDSSDCPEGVCSEKEPSNPLDPSEPIGEKPTSPETWNEPVSALPSGKYDYVDPNHLVPDRPLEITLRFYEANLHRITNKNWLTVIDFNQHSSQKRFYLINMQTGAVTLHKVAHGTNSDKDNDGWPTTFSNVPESRTSSLGMYVTVKTYIGKQTGYSLRIDGLEKSNDNAYDRGIVVHGSKYVNDSNDDKSGRSYGCPALDDAISRQTIDQIKGGSLLYIWYNQ